MKLPDFPAAQTPGTGSKLFFTTSSPRPHRLLLRFCKFCKFWVGAGTLSLAFHAFAAEPAPAVNKPPEPPLSGSTTVAPATAPAPAVSAAKAAPSKFDWSKQPPVTAPPRPGMFSIAPTGPNYYSLSDLLTGNKRDAAPLFPYAPYALMTTPAFDMDFRYREKPGYEPDFFDPLKRIKLGDDFLLTLGGSFWYRYMRESDLRLTNRDDNYHMIRSRFHADLWYRDNVRLFAEFLDARTFGQSLAPLPTDVNHTDMLNLFADVKVASTLR